MTAASFDEIEAIIIAASQTATFTGAQLTGEAIALTGQSISTSESVIVNVSQGATFVSGLTSGSGIDSLSYVGNIGAETITGSALAETITGGEGNDLLTGGAGIDTYVFSDTTGTGNGIDSIVLSSLTANAAEDIFNFSAYTFVGTTVSSSKVELKKIFADADVTAAVTDDATGQNILFLTGDYFASSTELASALTLFADIDVGNVLILYAGSSTDSTRIALCSINEAGDVVTATDMAVLVGLTISNASTALSESNFILG